MPSLPFMRRAAFFDLDNTVVRGSSLWHFGRYLMRRGYVPRREVWRFARAEAQLALRRTEPIGGPEAIATRVLALARGRSVAELTRLAGDFCDSQLESRLVTGVVHELDGLVARGVPTYLVTASPIELALAVADRLGMAGAVGTQAEAVHGIYTGRLAAPLCHGSGKLHAVTALARREDLDLGASWAFSDSINDLPLLASVGTPVAVNPNDRFALVAAKNGWRILDGARDRLVPQPAPTIGV